MRTSSCELLTQSITPSIIIHHPSDTQIDKIDTNGECSGGIFYSHSHGGHSSLSPTLRRSSFSNFHLVIISVLFSSKKNKVTCDYSHMVL